ncbi:MAG: rhomboid family intramembrane serine protease [Chlorobi bacterium]|nr:rhomboid family intramembrane serine protease [Chlorobiota bacterium]
MNWRDEIASWRREPVYFYIGASVVVSVFFWLVFFVGETGLIRFGHLWQYFALPAGLSEFVRRPWTLATYPFIHLNLVVFIINILLLHFIGTQLQILEHNERLFRLSIAGIIAGALGFWSAYYGIPAWFKDEQATYLTGVSVVHTAWLGYAGMRYGDYPLNMRLFGRWKWRWLLWLFLVWDLVQLPLVNTGGHAAHLAAMTAGILYAWILQKRRSKRGKFNVYDNYKTAGEKQIDRILDKINRHGLDSLTDEEREILYRESKRKNKL